MAGRSGATATRKRTREQSEDDTTTTTTATSATKKQRIKLSDNKATATNYSLHDANPVTKKASATRRGAPSLAAKATNTQSAKTDTWEVPDSEEERHKPAINKPDKPNPKRSQDAVSSKQKSNVYDVPDSDEDELANPAVTRQSRLRRSHHASSVPAAVDAAPQPAKEEDEPEPPKKRRGRPPKKFKESQTSTVNDETAIVTREPSPTAPRPSTRATGRVRPSCNGAVNSDKTAAGVTVVAKASSKEPANDHTDGHESRPLKGILTPRKQRGDANHLRAVKSVAFDDKPDEDALDSLATQTPSKSNRKPQQDATRKLKVTDTEPKAKPQDSSQESGEEEEDDEVCAICLKPDSAPPNEIVFCDSCDMPVHQECYGIPEIPEGEWICRNCSQEGINSRGEGVAYESNTAIGALEEQRPDIPNFDQHLQLAQRVLLDRCAGRRRIKLRGQDDAYKKAHQLVEQTVVAGEGNSMLVIGARGSGKTTLVESIIHDMAKNHGDDFHVVRLNGFIHTDDKLALREIWRQLGKEMEVEDELVNKTTNYADTMASLLALLSHPSEIAETQEGVTSKSVIFVIDEFDLFATHPRQTLLYNLFDIAQARKAPIAVLGLTTRIDVVESLEKRVKSRFSHRYVYLSLPTSLPAYWDICKQGLTVDNEDMLSEGIDPALEGHHAFWDWWNGRIESLYKTQSFADHLESYFYRSKSVAAFFTSCILPLASLSPTAPFLTIPATSGLAAIVSLEPPDSKLHLLSSLSDLDLSMLIAAARLDIVAHTDTVNFAMAYDEYTSLMSRQRVQSAASGMLALGGGARIWGRGVASMAWERLATLGLLVPAAPGGRGMAGLGGLDAKMWKVDVALEEIPAAVKLNAVLARWCKEI